MQAAFVSLSRQCGRKPVHANDGKTLEENLSRLNLPQVHRLHAAPVGIVTKGIDGNRNKSSRA